MGSQHPCHPLQGDTWVNHSISLNLSFLKICRICHKSQMLHFTISRTKTINLSIEYRQKSTISYKPNNTHTHSHMPVFIDWGFSVNCIFFWIYYTQKSCFVLKALAKYYLILREVIFSIIVKQKDTYKSRHLDNTKKKKLIWWLPSKCKPICCSPFFWLIFIQISC